MNLWGIGLRAATILFPLLSGCATTIVEDSDPAATRESATLESMRFVDLAVNKSVVVTIDGKSPSYRVDERQERFAAFALPTDSSWRYLDFVSKPFGGITIHGKRTFVPVFNFLDSERKQVATVESGGMERRSSFTLGSIFLGRVAVPSSAKYVVVHGTTKAPGPMLIYADAGNAASVAASRLGEIDLTFSNVATATVRDSGQREDSSKAQIFYLAAVDGVSVENAAGESRRISSGQGFNLTTTFPSRPVPVKLLRVKLVATHATGAPIHAIASKLAGSFRSVEKEIEFMPEADRVYVVKGNLQTDNPTVWLEDAATGKPVPDSGKPAIRP
jgi:hypothetical protein